MGSSVYGRAIKDWSEDDQPRAKMINKGPSALSDAELLSILMGSGKTGQSALDISRHILESVSHNLLEFSRLSIDDLEGFEGVGPAKAVRLQAALELGRRRELAGALQRKMVSSSSDAYSVLKSKLSDLRHEEFWVLFLNNRNQVLAQQRISKGGLSGTTADPREVFQIALRLQSTGIILAHNHPSGALRPSASDDRLTQQMKAAGELLVIKVLDHLIITESGYFSYSDEGEL
ncbi:RadC family protein [Croceimicrobium hydrocarbonivorans]|uniref:DNA repair protein RadC n=1 Tax=Croceimicrobium hydrocarbonivorans TaxID=2761580 RepID=A0A7H0VGG5_9FLAO|nr:DNA repair protein RadC [Croceimicrobium hydrocarbonivorans]QNR24813.1 DNA repair protein RadC [Croceimicrobium hydrocarbonivorans]